MIRISRIIAELDKSISDLSNLRRELISADDTEQVRLEQQANQHGDNPMGGDGSPR